MSEMSKFQAWVLACRPATLTAAFVPVSVGAAVSYSHQSFELLPVLAALFGAFAIQIGTNFANDVFDFKKGADNSDRLGPTRAVEAGLISAKEMTFGMVVAFSIAALFGVYLIAEAGIAILILGIISILSGIAYTGGPYPLAYNGLGDIFVFIFFGFVAVCGTCYVQGQTIPSTAWAASIPIGALATAILVVNNVRDRHTDVVANKKTLIVRFGRRFGVAEYIILMLMAYLTPIWLLFRESSPPDYSLLLPLLTLPWAGKLTKDVMQLEGKPLNETLASTAKLLLLFGVLWTFGLSSVH